MHTQFGEATVVTYAKVEKKDGTYYFRISDKGNEQITEEEYLKENNIEEKK